MQNPYDITAYPCRPVSESHPGRLLANCRLFGLSAAPIETASILEVGCATGNNIIPLAYRYPRASFIGFDYSLNQIAAGRAQIAALGLQNIRLEHASIEQMVARSASQAYDYILCHGVFSWVNTELQESIFSLCAKYLQPQGAAYISYNVFPGWNSVNTLRELMLWATRDLQDPQEKVSRAREVINNMASGFDEKVFPYAYAKQFRKLAKKISTHSDGYLAHEYLEDDNLPVYFYQFVESARDYLLGYVTECDLDTVSVVNLPEPFASQLANNTDVVALGQHIDFIRNTRFRRSILCHAGRRPTRNIGSEQIEQFFIQLEARPDKKGLSISNAPHLTEISLKVGDVTVTFNAADAIMCLALLHEHRNQPISYRKLCQLMMIHSSLHDIRKVRQFLNNEMSLISLVFAGVLSIHTEPGAYVSHVSDKPEACGLIRYQIAEGQNWVSTGKHTAIRINDLECFLLGVLDGNHTVSALCELVSTAIDEGKFNLVFPSETKSSRTRTKQVPDKAIMQTVRDTLYSFSKNGCLVA
ncbi:MAG: methyltransferase domain-containing protein [Desulfobacterales bacterium]|nr:methyltransferase domain-containing protein [Desulfobacterales bacterium]